MNQRTSHSLYTDEKKPDKFVNEDPYAFTWVYPTLLLVAFVAFWFDALALVALCLTIAGLTAFSMGLYLGRHLLPLDFATVHRAQRPKLFWTYTVMQALVVATSAGVAWLLLTGVLG